MSWRCVPADMKNLVCWPEGSKRMSVGRSWRLMISPRSVRRATWWGSRLGVTRTSTPTSRQRPSVQQDRPAAARRDGGERVGGGRGGGGDRSDKWTERIVSSTSHLVALKGPKFNPFSDVQLYTWTPVEPPQAKSLKTITELSRKLLFVCLFIQIHAKIVLNKNVAKREEETSWMEKPFMTSQRVVQIFFFLRKQNCEVRK